MPGPGDYKRTAGWQNVAFQFAGTFAGWSIAIEGSMDGDSWVEVIPAQTAPAVVFASSPTSLLNVPWNQMRVNVISVGANPAPTVIAGGSI